MHEIYFLHFLLPSRSRITWIPASCWCKVKYEIFLDLTKSKDQMNAIETEREYEFLSRPQTRSRHSFPNNSPNGRCCAKEHLRPTSRVYRNTLRPAIEATDNENFRLRRKPNAKFDNCLDTYSISGYISKTIDFGSSSSTPRRNPKYVAAMRAARETDQKKNGLSLPIEVPPETRKLHCGVSRMTFRKRLILDLHPLHLDEIQTWSGSGGYQFFLSFSFKD